jgi:hypothetical protein
MLELNYLCVEAFVSSVLMSYGSALFDEKKGSTPGRLVLGRKKMCLYACMNHEH